MTAEHSDFVALVNLLNLLVIQTKSSYILDDYYPHFAAKFCKHSRIHNAVPLQSLRRPQHMATLSTNILYKFRINPYGKWIGYIGSS